MRFLSENVPFVKACKDRSEGQGPLRRCSIKSLLQIQPLNSAPAGLKMLPGRLVLVNERAGFRLIQTFANAEEPAPARWPAVVLHRKDR